MCICIICFAFVSLVFVLCFFWNWFYSLQDCVFPTYYNLIISLLYQKHLFNFSSKKEAPCSLTLFPSYIFNIANQINILRLIIPYSYWNPMLRLWFFIFSSNGINGLCWFPPKQPYFQRRGAVSSKLVSRMRNGSKNNYLISVKVIASEIVSSVIQ